MTTWPVHLHACAKEYQKMKTQEEALKAKFAGVPTTRVHGKKTIIGPLTKKKKTSVKKKKTSAKKGSKRPKKESKMSTR